MPFDPSSLAPNVPFWFKASAAATGALTNLTDSGPRGNDCTGSTAGGTITASATPSGGKALVGTSMQYYHRERDLGLHGGPLIGSASSSSGTTFLPGAAVDGSTSTQWATANSVTTGWYRVTRRGAASAATSYQITPRGSTQVNQAPKTWTFEGSMDGSSWTVLDTRTNITSWVALTEQSFSFTNTTAYVYYRINFTAANGGSNVGFVEFKLDNVANTPAPLDAELWIVLKTNGGSGPVSWKFGTNASTCHYTFGGQIYDDFGSATRRNYTPTLDVSQWRLYRVRVSGTNWTSYVDNVSQLTTSSNTKIWNTTAPLILSSFSGSIAEYLVVDKALSATESANLIDYFNAQHGLSVPGGKYFDGSPAGFALGAPLGSYVNVSNHPQSFTGTPAGFNLGSAAGEYSAGVGYDGSPAGFSLGAPLGTWHADIIATPQSFTGKAVGFTMGALRGSYSAPTTLQGQSSGWVLGAGVGTYRNAREHLAGESFFESSSEAELPHVSERLPAGESFMVSYSEASLPTSKEKLYGESFMTSYSAGVLAADIHVDPVTLRPQYRLIIVDSFGNPGPELTQAEIGDPEAVLNGKGGMEFTLPKTDPLAAYVKQYDQVQLWMGDQMVPEAWYYIVDPVKDSGSAFKYQCDGVWWVLENVRIGKERPELLKNGGFEQNLAYWHPTWFAGSAAEAPPDTQIVTGAAALDGGKALQTTAVEKVVVKETKTDAIFLGNRPYAWEPLANGFVDGGEQVIKDMVSGFAKGIPITVECYTADVDAGTGQALSERRAEASKNVINGYRPDLIVTAIGRGETVQVAPNDTPANQAKNRRIVITGSSTKIGHRQAVVQRLTFTNEAANRVAVDLDLSGWINLINYGGPSKDRYGFYIDRRKTSAVNTILDYQHTDLPPEFPKEKWKADSTSIKAPADGVSYTYEVRLYGAAGDTKFDEISVQPDLFTRFFNVDRPTLFKKLIEHGQDPAFSRVDLNLTTNTPAYGTKDDYEYRWADHRTVDDAIREQLRADDAPDFGIVVTPTTRTATTWARRGRYTGILLEIGGILTDYTEAVQGDEVATTAFVTSDLDGGAQAEAVVRRAPLNGLVLERLDSAEPNRLRSRLRQFGQGMLRYGHTDVLTSVTCHPAWTVYLLTHVGLGDTCPIRVGTTADGNYRIVGWRLNIGENRLTYQVLPEA